MISEEALELAIHRSLRAEIPPCVRGILATTISPELIELQVFHFGALSQLMDFEAVVESELEQCLPAGVAKAPRLRCQFLPGETFEASSGRLIIHNNPWAAV